MNRAQMEKARRKVERRLANGVPYDLWSDDEQLYYIWVYAGGACPSSAPLGPMQSTSTIKAKDAPTGG
jgi:hypothetical protein